MKCVIVEQIWKWHFNFGTVLTVQLIHCVSGHEC